MSTIKQFPLEEEYKKPTGIRPEDISALRAWLKTQPHLPEQHITDLDLILAYHCCGRSSEVTKQLIDLHFTLKTLFTNFFKDRFMNDKIEKTLRTMLIDVLPKRTKEGYTVYYVAFLNKDPKNFVLADIFRAGLMVLDLYQYAQGTWPGFVIVIDLEGMSMGHLAKLDIQSVQQYLYYLQEAMLVNLKGLHYINAPSFMDRIMMLLRPFLSKALMEMIQIHQSGTRSLDKYYSMENLPKGTAGGQYRSFEELRDDIIAMMNANKEFFVEENKKRVTEAKRPGKPKTISDIFGGVEGSFKKLEID